MRLQVAPEGQGQMVEVSYGWFEGSLYRRTYDHADRTETWAVADQDQADTLPEDWEAVNGAPDFDKWTPCATPRGDA